MNIPAPLYTPGNVCYAYATSGKPHERTTGHAWRTALRATLTSPRLVGRLQRNFLFRVASSSHPWLDDPIACRRSASLKAWPVVRSWDFPNAGTNRIGVRVLEAALSLFPACSNLWHVGVKCRRFGAYVMPLAAPGRLRSCEPKSRTVQQSVLRGLWCAPSRWMPRDDKRLGRWSRAPRMARGRKMPGWQHFPAARRAAERIQVFLAPWIVLAHPCAPRSKHIHVQKGHPPGANRNPLMTLCGNDDTEPYV